MQAESPFSLPTLQNVMFGHYSKTVIRHITDRKDMIICGQTYSENTFFKEITRRHSCVLMYTSAFFKATDLSGVLFSQ